MKAYTTYLYENKPDWNKVPEGKMENFLWGTERYKPKAYFQMCLVKNEGIYIRLRCEEIKPKATHTKSDEPVYKDSCLEAFLKLGKEGYINIETNAKGVYLSEFGKFRENRTFLKEITDVSPIVTPFMTEKEWGNEIFVSETLLYRLYPDFPGMAQLVFSANFTKCGDETEIPHYCSFSPLGEFSKGFHNPDEFAIIIVLKDE